MNTHHLTLTTPDGFLLDTLYTFAGAPVVVLCHGMTVNKEDETPFLIVEPLLHQLGISTIRFDFRAHGKSSGNSVTDFTITGELKDLETIVGFAQSKGHTVISFVGASFGGAVAALYAGYNPGSIRSLVLLNPALDLAGCFLEPVTSWGNDMFSNWKRLLQDDEFLEIGSKNFRVGKNLFLDLQDYHPDVVLTEYRGPLLIIQGDKDDKVEPGAIEDIFVTLQNDDKQLEILRGAQHGFHDEPFTAEAAELMAQFFERTLRQT